MGHRIKYVLSSFMEWLQVTDHLIIRKFTVIGYRGMLQIQTFSIVAGSEVCNARCPFCISKQTVANGIDLKEPIVNWRNFNKACRLAEMSGVTTTIITSKGEPTLFPNQITEYLLKLKEFNMPIVELQTNGIPIANNNGDRFFRTEPSSNKYGYLADWYEAGLTTVIISVVHFDIEKNRQIYLPHKKEYIDIPNLISILHQHGFSVRLSCIGLNGYIDNVESFKELIKWAKDNKVEQLSYRGVTKPEVSRDDDVSKWTENNFVPEENIFQIEDYLNKNATLLMNLIHNAKVYDYKGQNVCLTNCLTYDPNEAEIRQLIFFPNGKLRYSWQHEGAILF